MDLRNSLANVAGASLHSGSALLHEPFIGLNRELCFASTWLRIANTGYPLMYIKELGRDLNAHRLAVMLMIGPVTRGDMVLHRCGDRRCYNPFHLYVGGHEENLRDKILHKQAGATGGSLVDIELAEGVEVLRPRPVALSTEVSRLLVEFEGLEPDKCHHADWLTATDDGFRQLIDTRWPGDVVGAQRKIYELYIGKLGVYDIVSHTCGDLTCLNPYHLFCAGQQRCRASFDLKRDKRRKLSAEALAEIADRSRSAKYLAQKYGVHPMTIQTRRANMRPTHGVVG
ncbi:hypothetical protein ECAE60S_04277 [Eoetvoesiella caeni]